MSKLQKLIKDAVSNKTLQERVYGGFPLEIASECGVDEVAEIISKLDELAIQKKEVSQDDGDTRDQIWRAQISYSKLIEKLLPKFTNEISKGLESEERETAFYISHAMWKAPVAKAIPFLREYLKKELEESERNVGENALKACLSKRTFINKILGKNN